MRMGRRFVLLIIIRHLTLAIPTTAVVSTLEVTPAAQESKVKDKVDDLVEEEEFALVEEAGGVEEEGSVAIDLEDPEDLSTAVVSQSGSSVLHLTQVDDSMAERIKDLPKRRKRVNR